MIRRRCRRRPALDIEGTQSERQSEGQSERQREKERERQRETDEEGAKGRHSGVLGSSEDLRRGNLQKRESQRVRERERERESQRVRESERERERERERTCSGVGAVASDLQVPAKPLRSRASCRDSNAP